MKVATIAILSVALFCTSFTEPPAVSKGIQFKTLTFEKALTEARQQHKFVFLNAYAVWCAPCKLLKETTFQSPKIASLVNSRCISLDVDVEKGEGIAIARKYDIKAHPQMLIITPDGILIKRIRGYMDESQLLEELKDAIK